MEAYLFMLIFAAVLFLVAASLYFSRDPRRNIFFSEGGGSRSMSKDAAVRHARQLGKGIALVALVIAVGSLIGLWREDLGWWIILSGVIAAVLYAIRLARLPDEAASGDDPSSPDDPES